MLSSGSPRLNQFVFVVGCDVSGMSFFAGVVLTAKELSHPRHLSCLQLGDFPFPFNGLDNDTFCFLHVLLICAFLSWDEKLLELAAFPSAGAKLPILVSMIMSLVGPFAVDRLCVRLFDPELHNARKAGPPLTSVVRNNIILTLRLRRRLFRSFVR